MKKGIAGPTAEERDRERSLLWGRVEDGEGRAAEGTVETLEGYALTAETAAAAAERVLHGDVAPGAWTPSRAFGARFVESIRDTKLTVPSRADVGSPGKRGARKG
jgi:short subunit dehydrogenase-like uncharacterized protein